MPDPKHPPPLERRLFEARRLMAEHPPRWRHRNKQAVFEIACPPGSSPGGEQPKFTTVVGPPAVPVIVKFSPRLENDVAVRRADLLVAEHLAAETMRRHGHPAVSSEIVSGGGQVFLEVKRFDRVGTRGRRGVISMQALEAEFLGGKGGWSRSALELERRGRIPRELAAEVCWRQLFGGLIANSDTHSANLSFFSEIDRIIDVAPSYDMLPMLYYPQNDAIVDREFSPPLPASSDLDDWPQALEAAGDFWSAATSDSRISDGFRSIAANNFECLGRLRDSLSLLPKRGD